MSSAGAGRSWTTPADIAGRLRRSWDSGSLLSGYATGVTWVPTSMPLHGPGAFEVAERLDAVRAWVDVLERGSRRAGATCYRLEYRSVGGRLVGANRLPARAWLDDYDSMWTLLDVHDQVRRYVALLDRARETAAEIADWMLEHPRRTLQLSAEWDRLLPTVAWLANRAGTGVYLRQIDIAGVDTKYVEAQRRVLADLLDRLLAPRQLDGSRSRGDFERRYGFLGRPPYVRFRLLGPARC
jgi:hypothetical protein